eukprot:Lithocolla_globosa_v1_NODE_2643_length_1922_cov_2.867167.p3 type:complete len:133 gc:universal NODE_2643_length_1922_cov_2.867167:622-224(-)
MLLFGSSKSHSTIDNRSYCLVLSCSMITDNLSSLTHFASPTGYGYFTIELGYRLTPSKSHNPSSHQFLMMSPLSSCEALSHMAIILSYLRALKYRFCTNVLPPNIALRIHSSVLKCLMMRTSCCLISLVIWV